MKITDSGSWELPTCDRDDVPTTESCWRLVGGLFSVNVRLTPVCHPSALMYAESRVLGKLLGYWDQLLRLCAGVVEKLEQTKKGA